jgi:plasmid stabilization system protein ParE
LESIRDYLRDRHPAFTQPTIRKLYAAARSLKQFPHRGRIGQWEGTRELVMAPLVEPDVIHIFRVMHTSQQQP